MRPRLTARRPARAERFFGTPVPATIGRQLCFQTEARYTLGMSWRRTWFPAMAVCAVAPMLVDCNMSDAAFGGLTSAACPELGVNADAMAAMYTSDGRMNAKIRAFMQASKDLMAVAAQAEAEAADACMRIGADLGMQPNEMAPRDEPGGRARGACEPVAARIDAILQQGIRFQAVVTPPQCQANASAQAQCSASCSGHIDPGQIVAQCEPGRLSGICQGRCTGRCDGNCMGDCQGMCVQRDAQGRCAGQCNGECYGTCDATCHARCEGTWQAPQCEGAVQGPSGDAECDASCKARAEFHASCTPIAVMVQPSAANQAAIQLAASLSRNLPLLLHAQIVLGQRILGDVDVVVRVGANMPQIVGQAGAKAAACVAAAASATARASVSIKVTVQASASVSGRAGAG